MLCEKAHSNSAQAPCDVCQSCRLFEAGNHPDLIVPEYDKTIGVDLIRECIGQLSKKSHLGGPMILLLHNIEAMTTASANALLKTLEEPTANTFLLMTTTSQSMLLPTILSRCEKQKIQVSQPQEARDWLNSADVQLDEQLLKMYWDRPLLLKDIMANDTLLESLEWLKSLHKMTSLQGIPASLLEEHQFITDWMSSKIKEVASTELSDVLKVRVHQTWQDIVNTEQQLLKQGVNKPLLLEKLLQNWRQTIILT
jgi:DNA polymerase-3 subunit delta'